MESLLQGIPHVVVYLDDILEAVPLLSLWSHIYTDDRPQAATWFAWREGGDSATGICKNTEVGTNTCYVMNTHLPTAHQ